MISNINGLLATEKGRYDILRMWMLSGVVVGVGGPLCEFLPGGIISALLSMAILILGLINFVVFVYFAINSNMLRDLIKVLVFMVLGFLVNRIFSLVTFGVWSFFALFLVIWQIFRIIKIKSFIKLNMRYLKPILFPAIGMCLLSVIFLVSLFGAAATGSHGFLNSASGLILFSFAALVAYSCYSIFKLLEEDSKNGVPAYTFFYKMYMTIIFFALMCLPLIGYIDMGVNKVLGADYAFGDVYIDDMASVASDGGEMAMDAGANTTNVPHADFDNVNEIQSQVGVPFPDFGSTLAFGDATLDVPFNMPEITNHPQALFAFDSMNDNTNVINMNINDPSGFTHLRIENNVLYNSERAPIGRVYFDDAHNKIISFHDNIHTMKVDTHGQMFVGEQFVGRYENAENALTFKDLHNRTVAVRTMFNNTWQDPKTGRFFVQTQPV